MRPKTRTFTLKKSCKPATCNQGVRNHVQGGFFFYLSCLVKLDGFKSVSQHLFCFLFKFSISKMSSVMTNTLFTNSIMPPPHTHTLPWNQCCFILSSSHSSCFMENAGERGLWASASHLVGRHLQRLDNNGLETTLRPQWSCLCSGNGGGAHSRAATPPVPLRSKSPNNQPGQSPDTFPSNFHCRMCSFSG